MRRVVVGLLELAGLCAFVAGWFTLAPWLGLVVGGAVAVIVAFALESAEAGDQ